MKHSHLTAISPIDGRYASKTESLREIVSEYGLMRYRTQVEVSWLVHLCSHLEGKEVPTLSKEDLATLEGVAANFDLSSAEAIKEIEQTTNHDVKAIEYYLKDQMTSSTLKSCKEWVHFGCTSEDINNLSYNLMLRDAREECLLPLFSSLVLDLREMAKSYADAPMMARTHGQPASPTTVGKEFANVVARLERQGAAFETLPFLAKMNGAVGNYNAHYVAFPEADWPKISCEFISSLGLEWNPYTTQIEPHDAFAAFFDQLKRINSILIDLSRDIWGYISIGYFTQKLVAGEVGSSTMPHKVNPIDFENAEGNLGLSNALCEHFSRQLPLSRWQRDLTDSTTLRNVGSAVAYTLIAWQSLRKGLSKLALNSERLEADLDANWALLAEPIQMVMRRYGVDSPYERLKALTRGQEITPEVLSAFIEELPLPEEAKKRLQALHPADYIGLAEKLAKDI